MTRSLILVLTAITAVGGRTAPRPADSDLSSYFPARVGFTRVYVTDGKDEQTRVVTAVKEHLGAQVATVETRIEGAEAGPVSVVIRGESISFVHFADGSENKFLVARPRPGHKWSITRKADWNYEASYTVVGVESVEVPAGTFQALRVDCDVKLGPWAWTERIWHAAGVGMVKTVCVSPEKPDEVATVLKSYTTGTK